MVAQPSSSKFILNNIMILCKLRLGYRLSETSGALVSSYHVRRGNAVGLLTVSEMRQFKIMEVKIDAKDIQRLVELGSPGCKDFNRVWNFLSVFPKFKWHLLIEGVA